MRDIETLAHRTFQYPGKTTLEKCHDGCIPPTDGLPPFSVLRDVIQVTQVCYLSLVMSRRGLRHSSRQASGVTSSRYYSLSLLWVPKYFELYIDIRILLLVVFLLHASSLY